jgi:hypothetical protein
MTCFILSVYKEVEKKIKNKQTKTNTEQFYPENVALNIGCHFGNNILFLFLQFAEKGNDLIPNYTLSYTLNLHDCLIGIESRSHNDIFIPYTTTFPLLAPHNAFVLIFLFAVYMYRYVTPPILNFSSIGLRSSKLWTIHLLNLHFTNII